MMNHMMKLTIDTHLHSDNSVDGKSTLDEMCKKAIDKNFETICFTEHLDLNAKDRGYKFYDYEKYINDINQAKERFAGEIEILKGLEFSEPHHYPFEFEKLSAYDFDFILGSVHWFGDYWVGDKEFQKKYPIEEIYEIHYQETLKAIKFGGFDALGHIDFPKQFLSEKYEPVETFDLILPELVKRDIVLEINSAPVRRGFPDVCPSDTICELYVSNGGKNVTIGSDAHRSEDIGKDFEVIADKLVRYGLNVIYFKNRHPRKME